MAQILKGWLIFSMLIGTCVYAIAEDITLSTYYPSPRGVYRELRTRGNTNFASDANTGVAIGTTNAPALRLEVVGPAGNVVSFTGPTGTTFFDPGAGMISSSGAIAVRSGAANDIISLQNGAGQTRLHIVGATGNIGIGTTNPTQRLDVAGQTQVDRLVVNAWDNVNEGGEIQLDGANGQTTWIMDTFTNRFRWHHDGLEYVAIAPNGFVGIGTWNPQGRLHVNRFGANADHFRVNEDPNVGIELRSETSVGTPYIDFQRSGGAPTDYDVRLMLIGNDTLQIVGGTIQLPNAGAPAVNRVLKSIDGNGTAQWMDATAVYAP